MCYFLWNGDVLWVCWMLCLWKFDNIWLNLAGSFGMFVRMVLFMEIWGSCSILLIIITLFLSASSVFLGICGLSRVMLERNLFSFLMGIDIIKLFYLFRTSLIRQKTFLFFSLVVRRGVLGSLILIIRHIVKYQRNNKNAY
jgi:hypothetical protein